MFDVGTYLQRIGCAGKTGVDINTLRELHRHHLAALPYNGAAQDLRDGIRLVDLDEDAMFEVSVVDGQGGTCFQLARLFHRLLRELGYDVTLLAGSTAEGRENFGLDVEHMFNRVTLDGAEWIADVGYPGPSFLEPLLVTDAVQTQYGCQYRLVEHGSGYALQRRGRVSRWSVVYTFTMDARQWSDWKPLEEHLNREYAEEPAVAEACPIARGTDRLFSQIEEDTRAHGGRDVLCGRAFAGGQVVLKGRRYLTVRDGREEVRTITDDDEQRALITSILTGDFR
ncbi:arylamine N-acetyltransferase [Actinokineospora sp. PR83]|uniref:arylamine N-acetyltransferase n=1 Tax=Actinokineospora sp. PR83 TaxID=2884908 RepID=UPI0027DEF0C3|nr:arylamine N-acetyltransferase [Actinokineospora sp. PR83]MCG8915900.1 arylamine N-acetyltransferase [Actinokineospora sp. PR83]